jgi:hypothetical protein
MPSVPTNSVSDSESGGHRACLCPRRLIGKTNSRCNSAIALKNRIVKVQTTLVASPRNQRYLHPRSLGAGVPVCEIDKGGKLAIKLHPELSIVRYEPDLFDKLTGCIPRLLGAYARH